MDLNFRNLPHEIDKWTMTRKIATILHSEEFPLHKTETGRLVNFSVQLAPSSVAPTRNNGSGILTLPNEAVASKFLAWVHDNPFKMDGNKIKFFKKGQPPLHGVALTLQKTPYVDPDIEEKHQIVLQKLEKRLRVAAVQFGVFYRSSWKEGERPKPRSFSVEWEHSYVNESIGWLSFEYDHKLLRIKLGNDLTETSGKRIAIPFVDIQKIAVGHDPKPYICFDTVVPPSFEEVEFYRELTGDEGKDTRKYIHRIGSLHPGHERVSPYCPHLRVVLYNDSTYDVLDDFIQMCNDAGVGSQSTIIRCGPVQIETSRKNFFSDNKLYHLRKKFAKFSWCVAFQLETLLHNGLLHTEELDGILPAVESLYRTEPPEHVGGLLRSYVEKLQVRPSWESALGCFNRVKSLYEYQPHVLSGGDFLCYHATITPTRIILAGPYPSQSNRVIRKYRAFEEHFIRVDFRDENQAAYRWEREVDGKTFIEQRVGGTLKNGFTIAGRYFQFLAYSSSSLREHAVWFMNPFTAAATPQDLMPKIVTPEYIRSTLGDFHGSKLLRQPSKYAARLAQAFTATDPSVQIPRHAWKEVDDLGDEPYLFTDGVGTISPSLGKEIWYKLTESDPGTRERKIEPLAYQIRFLGFKGMVAVDARLKDDPIRMRLRPSMNKFGHSAGEHLADIEIAKAFDKPTKTYLNRALVMLLADLGVRKETFLELQNSAVEKARRVDDGAAKFREFMTEYNFGSSFKIPYILQQLEDLTMDLKLQNNEPGYDNSFFQLIRAVAKNDVLRDIKHNVRIEIPNSYLLVGVADEGPAYKSEGLENVYTLQFNEIYACVQETIHDEPRWIEGSCLIARSPVVHPGDVQRVKAIGKPPPGKICLFGHLKNVVVLPSVGDRSLASCLGGGDLDGDEFAVINYSPLLTSLRVKPANYESTGTLTLERDSTVDDICDFIVEYINSDVIGLLSDRLLIIADQSDEGMRDLKCLRIAALCSQAVDYPKQGIPVDLDKNKLPSTLIRCKPDWHANEVVPGNVRDTDYYESEKALGLMYREIKFSDVSVNVQSFPKGAAVSPTQIYSDPISVKLLPLVERHLSSSYQPPAHLIDRIYQTYVDELNYICAIHTLSNKPEVRLLEAEVVVGTILANDSQRRLRKDRSTRMRTHATTLVATVRRELLGEIDQDQDVAEGLGMAWAAWGHSRARQPDFGADSFGLIALAVIFHCLESLGPIPIPDPW